MCWCDGVTPGVQECQSDMTFAPCICDGEGSGPGDGGEADGVPSASDTGQGPGQDSDTGTSPTDPTTAGNGSNDETGDPVPTDCTDELFSLWQSCRQLAGINNPSSCGPCVGGNTCENAACTIDCAEQGNPGFEADLAACDLEYPQCEGLYDVPTDPYVACTQGCGMDFNECMADLAPACDPPLIGECSTSYNACIGNC